MRVEPKALSAAFVAVVLSLSLAGPVVAGEERDEPQAQHLHEGAISITGEGLSETMTVLGGQLGRETVNGMNVGLFVLQAESPERLEPGAKGPTHVFNVTFLEVGKPGFVAEVRGALIIEGAGEPRKVDFRPYESHYQAATRLEQEGDYRIRVEFRTDGTEGQTAAFPFRYQTKKHGEHRH
jgi:hypothetical protein